MLSDLSSPKNNDKKYKCYKVSDVAGYFEDDDNISIVSGDSSLDSLASNETGSSRSTRASSVHSLHSSETGSSRSSSVRSVQIVGSDSDSSSCYSNESGPVRRSGRNTPVRDFDDSSSCHSNESESVQRSENTPTKRNTPTRAAKSRNSPARNSPTKTTPKANLFNVKPASAKKDVFVENKDILRVKSIEDDNVRKSIKDKVEENVSKTPDRKRGSAKTDEEEIISVKKCKTEPRRKSLQPQIVVRKSPRTEVKVRRAQSVRIKRVGNEFKSFRDQTPDSSGPRTRTRLSEKFENCKKAEEIKNSGREAFTEITNKQSSGRLTRSNQSPAKQKPSPARSKRSPARNKTPDKSNQSPTRTNQSLVKNKQPSANKKTPVKSSQSPAVSANGKSPKPRSSRRK